MAHLQAERDRTRATEIEAAKRAAVEQAAMSRVAGLEGPSGPSMMQRALGSISLGGIATGFAAVAASIAAATFALQRFGSGMLDAAAAASEAEQAERRAIATIRLHGEFSDRQFEALKRNNLERQRQLGIDADLQAQMQGTLSAMGVQAGALDKATQAAIGLSRATGLGLTEASRAVAKALGGHVESLREYGIRVGSVTEAEARMADMFRASQAQSGTYGVAVSALSAAWGDLVEAIGALITQNPQVMTTINSIIGGIESMTGSLSQGGKTAKGLGTIVTTTFKLIGTSAQVTASLISNMIGALNFFARSPNLMRVSRDLDKSRCKTSWRGALEEKPRVPRKKRPDNISKPSKQRSSIVASCATSTPRKRARRMRSSRPTPRLPSKRASCARCKSGPRRAPRERKA
jgi:hypothetical protein